MDQNQQDVNNVTNLVCSFIANKHSVSPDEIIPLSLRIYNEIKRIVNEETLRTEADAKTDEKE